MNKEITLFNIYGESHFKVEPLPMKRSWMNEVIGTNAYQCVPMNIANYPPASMSTYPGSTDPLGYRPLYS